MRSWYVMLPLILLVAAAVAVGVARITVPLWGERDGSNVAGVTFSAIGLAGVMLWNRHLNGRPAEYDMGRGSAEDQALPELEEEPETTIKKPGWRAYVITYPGIVVTSVASTWVLVDSGAVLFGVDVPLDVQGTIAFFVVMWSAPTAYALHWEHEAARKREIEERKEYQKACRRAERQKARRRKGFPGRDGVSSVSELREAFADAEADLRRKPDVLNYQAAKYWADRLDYAERREAEERRRSAENGLVPVHGMTRAEWIAAGKPEGPIPEHEIPGRTISDSKNSLDSSGK